VQDDVERQCYSRCGPRCQTEQPACVVGGCPPKLVGVDPTSGGHSRNGVGDPRRLIPFPAKGDGREVGRIRLHKEPVGGNKPEKIVVRPFPERNDPAERDVPPRGDRVRRERVRARVTVHHTHHSGTSRPIDHRSRVVFGFASVYHNRALKLRRQLDLRRERRDLRVTRGIVVVIVEAAFPDGDGTGAKVSPELRDVARGIEARGVVRMHASGSEDEARIGGGNARSDCRPLYRFTNADNCLGARGSGARDYRVAVAVERWVREVGVTVDEDWREPALRGHLRSIQRRTGAAT